MKHKIVSHHDLLNLVADYHDITLPITAVSKRNGISITLLTRRLLDAECAGIPVNYRRGYACNAIPDATRAAILVDYQDNTLSFVGIAEKHHVSLPTIRNIERVAVAKGEVTKRIEVVSQHNERYNINKLREWAVAKLQAGWQPSALARIVGVSRERVRQWGNLDGAGYQGKNFIKNSAGSHCPHCRGNLMQEYLITDAKQYLEGTANAEKP